MKIKYIKTIRASTLLRVTTSIAIAWMPRSASAQSSMTLTPRLEIFATFSQTLGSATNDNNFMREQLHNSGSNLASPLLPNDNSGWTQPIVWAFGLIFVSLGAIVAWSKYARKR